MAEKKSLRDRPIIHHKKINDTGVDGSVFSPPLSPLLRREPEQGKQKNEEPALNEESFREARERLTARSSAHICQRPANAFSYMCLNLGIPVLNYLDDFGGVERKQLAWFVFNTVRQIFKLSGFEEAFDRACEPSESMVLLGILFNTRTMTMSVTLDKLMEIRNLVKLWQEKTSASLKEIQSLLGKLNFVVSDPVEYL